MEKPMIYKEDKISMIIIILKILSLLSCTIPLIICLADEEQRPKYIDTYIALGVAFLLLFVLMCLWIFIGNQKNRDISFIIPEIMIFFIVCFDTVYFTGFIESYFKFVYIFMILLYTIELGKKAGISISLSISFVLLGSDLLLYDDYGFNQYFTTDFIICTMFMTVAWVLGYYAPIANYNSKTFISRADIDSLTKTYSPRYFYESLKKCCEECSRTNKPLSLIMLDIDYFDVYNDLYGNEQGDAIIKELAKLIGNFIKQDGIVSRYSDNEFAIILNDTNIHKSSVIANKLHQSITDHVFTGQGNMPSRSFCVSIGVSELGKANANFNNLVKRAEFALYKAKYLRKNSVEVYTPIFEELDQTDENASTLDDTILSLKTLITIINSRDSYTFNHTERVVQLCSLVADYMKLPANEKKRLCYAAYLHDLGKINISKDILLSDKKLTPEEWEELKCHPADSAKIISNVEGFEDIVPIVLQHHERYDGTGYPNKLNGNNIEYLARILSLADSFDAATNTRPYKKAMSYNEALEDFEHCAGTQFDPNLCKTFIEAVKTVCGDYIDVA